MNTPDAIRLLAEARRLQREGTPTTASLEALTDILKPTTLRDVK